MTTHETPTTSPETETQKAPVSRESPVLRVREMARNAAQKNRMAEAASNPEFQKILESARQEAEAFAETAHQKTPKQREMAIRKNRSVRMVDVRTMSRNAAFAEQARAATEKLQSDFRKVTPKPIKDDDSSGGHSSVHRNIRALPQPTK